MAATKDFSTTGESTIIGPSILINGKLSGDEDLTVRGRVEGELSLTKTLIVEPSGIVKVNVQVRNAIISGVVVGNISATESVELTRDVAVERGVEQRGGHRVVGALLEHAQ